MKPILLFIGIFAVASVHAVSPNVEIRHKSRDLEKVKKELDQKREETERLKKEAEALKSDIQKSKTRIGQIEETLNVTRYKTREMSQKIAMTKNEHDRLSQDVVSKKEGLQSGLVKYYLVSAAMGATDVTSVYSRQLIQGQSQVLHGTKAQEATLRGALDSLIDSNQSLRREMERQESVLSDVRSGRQNKQKLLEKKQTRAETIQSELKELQRTSEELVSLIDILRSKARQEQEEQKRQRQANRTSGKSPIAARSLAWPMQGRIVEKFGRQKEPKTGSFYISNGIVVAAKSSLPVTAVSAGTVLFSGPFMRYGSMVLIEHPGDWYTVYGRLKHWMVEKGQSVLAGDVVGQSGVRSDGGNEVYFELRFYGKPVDPLPWLQP